jgi:hypothetical protein
MNRYAYNNCDISITECENEKFIINLKTGKIHKVNTIGSIIWESIPLGDVDFIIDKIFCKYAMDKETIKNDVVDYLKNLESEGLVVKIE